MTIKVLDYDKLELLTIQLASGRPVIGSIRVLNSLGEELTIKKIKLDLDDLAETYRAEIITNNGTRVGYIVEINEPDTEIEHEAIS